MPGGFQSVITMTNSVIGVSVLAMPFCFRQCGIILATLMLLMSGYLVKMSCHLLVKSAGICRRRNYETLAFHSFGAAGKMTVEVSMIGFMVGTCIAFFVVIGDLAPPIIASILNMSQSVNFSYAVQGVICFFLVLPLTLLRNLDSLFVVSISSVVFYCFVMLHIVFAAKSSIYDGTWTSSVMWWRPAGIFQCLPIFCMALACQCQVFEIYESLPDPSLSLMNEIVRGAVNICSGVYIAVGLFGYIACSEVEFSGNILTALPQSSLLQIVKLGFVLSVAVSFPLVVFPCRTSIHSLIYRKGNTHNEMLSNFIPSTRFNVITVIVVIATFITGILLPDIEFILGIVGSTIGNVICIILPSMIFLRLNTRNTTERLCAQAIFILGIILMILGTYVNLNEVDVKTGSHSDRQEHLDVQQTREKAIEILHFDPPKVEYPAVKIPVVTKGAPPKADNVENVRQEPVAPVAPEVMPAKEKPEESIFNKYDTLGLGMGKQSKGKEEELYKPKEELAREKEEEKRDVIEEDRLKTDEAVGKEPPKQFELEQKPKMASPRTPHPMENPKKVHIVPLLDPDVQKINFTDISDVDNEVKQELSRYEEKRHDPVDERLNPALELRMDDLASPANSSDLKDSNHEKKEM